MAFFRKGPTLEDAGVGKSEEFGELVRRSGDVLTRGQRRVADYIVRHFDECAFQTSADIGKKAGVSEATVFRFSTTLGFKRFSRLQKFIRSGLVQRRIQRAAKPLEGIGDEGAILAQVAQFDAENVHQTMSQTSAANLRKAAELILAAPAICTIGMRSSAATAFYLTAALNQLFGNVTPLSLGLCDDIDRLRGMPAGTVVVGVSFFRYATQTLKIMRHARALGLPTIVITDSVMAPPARFGDVVLLAATASIHFLPSQTAGISLVNALLGCIALRGCDRVGRSLKSFEKSLADADIFCETP